MSNVLLVAGQPMNWPEAFVWAVGLVAFAVVGYAFCRYVIGDG